MLSNLVHHLFNSHPHMEDDTRWICILQGLRFFNSHPHKEDDAHICTTFPKNMFFNSHPHKEDDHSWRYQQNHNMFSTHILTRRMTCHNVCDIFKHFFFNSHPHKEDDAVKAVSAPTVAFSTHILTRRMTIKFLYRNDHIAFQLTSSQGG